MKFYLDRWNSSETKVAIQSYFIDHGNCLELSPNWNCLISSLLQDSTEFKQIYRTMESLANLWRANP